uniref:Uncharacterized protein n=1 Tax=Arundo donax TaxID=35708 RepID=A0A0A9FIG3_ARUDO
MFVATEFTLYAVLH